MEIYIYKDKEYELFTGSRGGKYFILNNQKHYVKSNSKKIKSKTKNSRVDSIKSNKGNSSDGRNSNNVSLSPKKILMSYYVPDPEHEGDIDYALHQLQKIGDFKISNIEREYTEDGEELTYACINFWIDPKDYINFKNYCDI